MAGCPSKPADRVGPHSKSGQSFLAEETRVASLLVTFVGLPGTGKSTLSARTAQLLRQRGIPCRVCEEAPFRKLRNKAAWVAREVIGHPWRAARSVRGILATRQRSVLDLGKMVGNWF